MNDSQRLCIFSKNYPTSTINCDTPDAHLRQNAGLLAVKLNLPFICLRAGDSRYSALAVRGMREDR